MPTGTRPPTGRLARAWILWPLVPAALVVQPACGTNDEATPPEASALADAEAVDAADASTAPDGEVEADAPVDPNSNADPRDLDAANGDPALDIASSRIFFESGAPWVRVTFFGAWPPSPQLYSWACSVLLGTENAPVATYTVQGSSGVQTDFADGIDQAKMTYAAEPQGFRVRFGDAALTFDRYGLECSVQKTADGARVDDTSGNFVVTTKNERAFGN